MQQNLEQKLKEIVEQTDPKQESKSKTKELEKQNQDLKKERLEQKLKENRGTWIRERVNYFNNRIATAKKSIVKYRARIGKTAMTIAGLAIIGGCIAGMYQSCENSRKSSYQSTKDNSQSSYTPTPVQSPAQSNPTEYVPPHPSRDEIIKTLKDVDGDYGRAVERLGLTKNSPELNIVKEECSAIRKDAYETGKLSGSDKQTYEATKRGEAYQAANPNGLKTSDELGKRIIDMRQREIDSGGTKSLEECISEVKKQMRAEGKLK